MALVHFGVTIALIGRQDISRIMWTNEATRVLMEPSGKWDASLQYAGGGDGVRFGSLA
jgi:hypothetical protein